MAIRSMAMTWDMTMVVGLVGLTVIQQVTVIIMLVSMVVRMVAEVRRRK